VVCASEDPLSPPRLGRALAGAIPNARFVEIADASHGVTITHAEEINRLLEQNLRAGDR
jgi:pimeloyl-ACP methyl ester carboxylesterase